MIFMSKKKIIIIVGIIILVVGILLCIGGYLIYHSALIMQTQMPDDSIMVIQYHIMLTEKVLTNQRKYTQLVDVLGDVGGLMEVMESVLGVICYLVADILYDKTMVNNLFSFDLEENMIKIKNKKVTIGNSKTLIRKITNNEDNLNSNKEINEMNGK